MVWTRDWGKGGTLFPPQALWWFSCNLVDNIICLGGGGLMDGCALLAWLLDLRRNFNFLKGIWI